MRNELHVRKEHNVSLLLYHFVCPAICTVGEINDKIIKKYIEEQGKEDILEDGFDV